MSWNRINILIYFVKRFTHSEADLMLVTATGHIKLIDDEDRNTLFPPLMDTYVS